MLSRFHSHLPSSVKCRVQINPNYYLFRLFPQLRPPLLAICAQMKNSILEEQYLGLLVLAMLIKIAVTSKVFWF